MAVHEVVPSNGGFQVLDVRSFGRARTLEGADYRPLHHFYDALADGPRIGGGQGGNDTVAPGEGGVLRDPEPSRGFAYGEAFALMPLDGSALAVADHPQAPAAGAYWAMRHKRVADLPEVQLLPRASYRGLAALLAN